MSANVDATEVNKFDRLAARWWDPQGEFKTLHVINPLRVDYLRRQLLAAHELTPELATTPGTELTRELANPLAGKRVLDIGCGGGLLSEALAQAGAQVTAIDLSHSAIDIAQAHAQQNGLAIDYRVTSAEDLAAQSPASFDVITCMEMLEHVPEPQSIVGACRELIRPGGSVFFSTLNRTNRAFWLAVVAAEYVLNLVPRGTHDHRRFIRPAELDHYCRLAQLDLVDLCGLQYDPLFQNHRLGGTVAVNYLAHYRAP